MICFGSRGMAGEVIKGKSRNIGIPVLTCVDSLSLPSRRLYSKSGNLLAKNKSEISDFRHIQSLRIVKMSTSFSSLPIVSLSALSSSSPSVEEVTALSSRLDEVFSTTGFAYLTDLPITFSHDEVFGLCDDFFGPNGLSEEEKMKLAKKTFFKNNKNTYRG
jgi:hypothetical protein